MKRIGKIFVKFFKRIWSLFDKFLITPITRLILKFMDISKNWAKSIDRLSGKKSTLLVVSLVLAFAVFVIPIEI